jgi:hypothetical protein
MKKFDSWRHVPRSLKTKGRWKRNGRQLRKNAEPAAVVHDPRFLEHGEDPGNALILERDAHNTLVTDYEVCLYSFEQTKEYRATDATRLLWEFCDIFLSNARRDYWVKREPLPDERGFDPDDAEWGNSKWSFMSPRECVTEHAVFTSGLLTESEVRRHLSYKQTIGVCNSTGWTRWLNIDLDYRGHHQDIFLEMAAVLLTRFNNDTWFPIIRADEISGVNLIRVFPKAVPLDDAINNLREELYSVDEEHPELAARAKAAGMKSFGSLELYPTRPDNLVEPGCSNNCRLPLAHGRIAALDRWIQPGKGKAAAPVKQLLHWLQDPDRKHMDPEEILETIRALTVEQEGLLVPDQPVNVENTSIGTGSGRRGREKDLLIDFWINGRSHGTHLDTQLLILARHAYFYGYRIDQAVYHLGEMVRHLPPDTDCGSVKLLKGDWPEINRAVRRAVDLAYTNNSHQPLSARSSKILKGVSRNFQQTGFDPLDPKTWHNRSKIVSSTIILPESLKNDLLPRLSSFLHCRDLELVGRLIDSFLSLVQSKENDQWGDGYFHIWLKTNFPQLDPLPVSVPALMRESGNSPRGVSEGGAWPRPETHHATPPGPPRRPYRPARQRTPPGSATSGHRVAACGCSPFATGRERPEPLAGSGTTPDRAVHRGVFR